MAITQNSKITWADMRGLFDRVNAERNRWGQTVVDPDTYIGTSAGNAKATAETPNKLKSLI